MRDITPAKCPLPSTHVPWHARVGLGACVQMLAHVCMCTHTIIENLVEVAGGMAQQLIALAAYRSAEDPGSVPSIHNQEVHNCLDLQFQVTYICAHM